MATKFSIITSCKARLDHLKETLPAMLDQAEQRSDRGLNDSCPESRRDHVAAHFPKARSVRVEGEDGFSNWRARNAGAAIAKGDFLVFCDADIVLASDAPSGSLKLLTPASFGVLQERRLEAGRCAGYGAGGQPAQGIPAIPRASFTRPAAMTSCSLAMRPAAIPSFRIACAFSSWNPLTLARS